jgi:plasmid stability protein
MKMIQVRNVPDDLHRSLRERAARDGTTMSHLILRELPRIAHEPSAEEVLARIRARSSVVGPSGADLIRADRDAR